MAAIHSNGGNRWNILGFKFTKRDALSSVYKRSMTLPWHGSCSMLFSHSLNIPRKHCHNINARDSFSIP
jgi:hypothetical protein